MSSDEKTPYIGKDAVVLGDPGGSVGEGAVVIRPTTPDGSIRIEGTVAAGRNTVAAPGTIAIGAGAVAGSVDLSALADLRGVVAAELPDIAAAIDELKIELSRPQKDISKIRELWSAISGATTVTGAVDLLNKVREIVEPFLQ